MNVGLLWGYMAPFSVSSLRYKQMYAIFNFAPDLHTNVLAYSLASLAEVLQAESPRRQISLRQTMIFTILLTVFTASCSSTKVAGAPREGESAHAERSRKSTSVFIFFAFWGRDYHYKPHPQKDDWLSSTHRPPALTSSVAA